MPPVAHDSFASLPSHPNHLETYRSIASAESHPSQNLDEALVRAYTFLRRLEHRLQFDEDLQTHTLPTDLDALDLLARNRRIGSRVYRLDGAFSGCARLLRADIAHNLRLDSAPAVPVADLYTGVLYDALDLPSMDTATRRRANRWLVVISALYGALRPTDKIPPYRLSMAVNLAELGPLASAWRLPLTTVLPAIAGRGVIVDCRSSTYTAAWLPLGDLATRWVQVRVPGATHMAKHTRGLVARHLCQEGLDPRTAMALHRVVAQRFETTLIKPARPGQPWILDTTVR